MRKDFRGMYTLVRAEFRGFARRYTFKQLMAGVTKENIHAEIKTGDYPRESK